MRPCGFNVYHLLARSGDTSADIANKRVRSCTWTCAGRSAAAVDALAHARITGVGRRTIIIIPTLKTAAGRRLLPLLVGGAGGIRCVCAPRVGAAGWWMASSSSLSLFESVATSAGVTSTDRRVPAWFSRGRRRSRRVETGRADWPDIFTSFLFLISTTPTSFFSFPCTVKRQVQITYTRERLVERHFSRTFMRGGYVASRSGQRTRYAMRCVPRIPRPHEPPAGHGAPSSMVGGVRGRRWARIVNNARGVRNDFSSALILRCVCTHIGNAGREDIVYRYSALRERRIIGKDDEIFPSSFV